METSKIEIKFEKPEIKPCNVLKTKVCKWYIDNTGMSKDFASISFFTGLIAAISYIFWGFQPWIVRAFEVSGFSAILWAIFSIKKGIKE